MTYASLIVPSRPTLVIDIDVSGYDLNRQPFCIFDLFNSKKPTPELSVRAIARAHIERVPDYHFLVWEVLDLNCDFTNFMEGDRPIRSAVIEAIVGVLADTRHHLFALCKRTTLDWLNARTGGEYSEWDTQTEYLVREEILKDH